MKLIMKVKQCRSSTVRKICHKNTSLLRHLNPASGWPTEIQYSPRVEKMEVARSWLKSAEIKKWFGY